MKIRDNRNKEWFWLDKEYLNGYAKHLGMSCTVVYLSLCRYANNDTQTCFPSMDTIAEQNGIGKRTVVRAIQKLTEWNIIEVEKSKKEDGTQANNIYTLLSKKEWKDKPSANVTLGKNRVPKTTPSAKNDTNRVTPRHYNNTNINKTNISEAIAPQVSEIIKDFEVININAKRWYGNKSQRKAIEDLIEEIGFDRLKSIVGLLPKTNKIQYITTITTPYQLLNKFSDLEAQLTKLKLEKEKIKSNIAFS